MVHSTSTQHKLDFNQLSGDEFERLVLFLLHEDTEYINPQQYGGWGDRGRDIIASRQIGSSTKQCYFQCKRYIKIGYSNLAKELEKIHQNSIANPDFRPDEIVFAISCDVSAKTKDKIVKRARDLGLSEPIFWTRPELDARVKISPSVRTIFFGIRYSLLPDIFRKQVSRELKKNRSKFIPKLYVPRLRTKKLLHVLVEPLENVKESVSRISRGPRIIEEPRPHNIKEFDEFIQRCFEITETGQMSETQFDIDDIIQLITEETEVLEKTLKDDYWSSTIREAISILRSDLTRISKQSFLILDPAGTGKTNLLCKWAHDSLDQNTPYHFLLLTGDLCISNESGIADSLLRSLSLSGVRIQTLPDLLSALEFFIKVENKPIVIAIDAINENLDIKSTNVAIKQFLEDLEDYPQIKVVITCRTDFIDRFDFHEDGHNQEVVEGLLRRFEPDEIERGIPLYLEHYNINAKFSEKAKSAMLTPFILRFFCEAYGDVDAQEVRNIGLISDIRLHKLFQIYEETKFKTLREKFRNRFRSSHQFKMLLMEIAGIMLSKSTNRVSFSDLPKNIGIIDVGSIYDRNSIYRIFLDEEIIIERTGDATDDFVQFSFDLYREYQQAEFLNSVYNRTKSGWLRFLRYFKFKRLVSSQDLSNSEGLLRFLFIKLRKESGINLWEISNTSAVIEGCLEGLAQLENEDILESDLDIIRTILVDKHRLIFDITLRNPLSHDWKLGLALQDDLLADVDMIKRDLLFGSFVYRNRDYVNEQVIDNLRILIKDENLEQNLCTIEALARSSIWLLGSNVTRLRYYANLALLELGLQRPEWMLNLIQEYWKFNDLYICERLLSLIYALSSVDSEIAISCAKQVYALFLDSDSDHYSTHFMIREYAKDIVLIACGEDSQMFSKSQLERIKKINAPIKITKRIYGKSRPSEKQTGWSNYPIKMDMKTYVFGHLAHFFNKHRCDATDVAIEIIHDLGYTEEAFEDIDGEIGQKYWSGQDYDEPPTRIERFGKKYAWQAYRILQGHWIDTLPFASEHSEDILRYAHREFDPLFPKSDLIIFNLGIDMLGKKPLDQRLTQPPAQIDRIALREDDWVAVGGHILQSPGENRRVAIGLESLLVYPSEIQSRVNEIQDGYDLSLNETIHYTCYNHEIPLRWECEYNGLASRLTKKKMDELFVMSGRSEFRIGERTHRYALRTDFIQSMGLTQRPRTMSFTIDENNDVVRTQSWEFANPEYTEEGEWILVRLDFLKEYLQRRKKHLIIILVADCWGQENNHFKREISHHTHLIQ